MSAQETNFKAIADAIREKEGTTDTIPAREFAERIRAISSVPEGLRTITLTADPPEGGTVEGGGMVSDSVRVAVLAVPENGYKFSEWKENGQAISRNAEYVFPVNNNRLLQAVFVEFVFEWMPATLPSSAKWNSVTYGNGMFVAMAYGSNKAAYSTDGIAWAETTLPSSANWYSVTYGNGMFVAIAYGSNKAAYSTDSVTWTETTLPSSANWHSITYGNGMFVAVADSSNKAAYAAV